MFRLFAKILEGEKKMSGLKQKAKEPFSTEKASPKTLDKAFYKLYKKIGEYSADSSDFAKFDKLGVMLDELKGFVEEEIKGKDEEIAKLTKQLEKFSWYCEDCEEWHAKARCMICAVHEVRKVRNGRGRNESV